MKEKIATRVAYGNALCEFGGNEQIFALDADLSACTMSVYFAKKYPDHFFNIGIAEADMIGIAAGFATTGKIVFCHSFAMFAAGRGYEQIRNSLAYPHLNVKVVGSHAGLTAGEDGATHQCIEDISLMRTIPGMTVLCPCDGNEAREAVKAMIAYNGPCYMRTGRTPVDIVTDEIPGYRFEMGKGCQLCGGDDVTIIATGLMVQESLKAAELLKGDGVSARVIDMHTIKPLDRKIIVKAAKETGAIVTAEEHNILGGLGAAICEVVCDLNPIPVLRVGINDIFGHSGNAEKLLEQYGLTPEHIADTAKQAIGMKQ
jgi:transketolase